jgi:hypothetical protein
MGVALRPAGNCGIRHADAIQAVAKLHLSEAVNTLFAVRVVYLRSAPSMLPDNTQNTNPRGMGKWDYW